MSEPRAGSDVKAAFFAGLTIAVLASFIGSGPLGWLVSPIVLLLFVYAACRAPLSTSLLVLTFFALTLENPGEAPAAGAWRSPLYPLGSLMLTRMRRETGVSALFFSGMDVIFATLILVAFFRRNTRASLPTPKPLLSLAYLALAGALYSVMSGLMRGGDSSIVLTQVDRVFYLPVVFLLFQTAFRGMNDYVALGKVVIVAAALRACQATYVTSTVQFAPDPLTGIRASLPYGTTHHDSMLFAWATVLLIALVLHRVSRGWRTLLLFLPIVVMGMIANQRRMVWVQIILVFLILYFVMPPNPIERKIRKALLLASPLGLVYVAAGWNSASGLFKPVRTIRSAVDSDVDSSTLWRDIENFNLVATWRLNPVLGTGYGHGFTEFVPLPPVDYPLERFIPHNSILSQWAFTGYFGYTALTLLWIGGVYFAIRAYTFAAKPTEKAAALVALAAVPIYYLQCYGDMGLGSWTGVFMVSSAIAVSGQLAVAVGAWPASAARRRRASTSMPANAVSSPPTR